VQWCKNYISKSEYNKLDSENRKHYNINRYKLKDSSKQTFLNVENRQLMPIRQSIIEKNIILESEFNKLKPEQKSLYNVRTKQQIRNGPQSYYNKPINYIKKEIKLRRLAEAERLLNINRQSIIKKNIIEAIEFNKLKPEQQSLYNVKNTKQIRNGIQSYYNKPISYIKKEVKKRLNEERKKLQKNQRDLILQKKEISYTEHELLNSEQQKLYYGDPLEARSPAKQYHNVYKKYIRKNNNNENNNNENNNNENNNNENNNNENNNMISYTQYRLLDESEQRKYIGDPSTKSRKVNNKVVYTIYIKINSKLYKKIKSEKAK
jgi:hypothetical protein